MRWPRRRPCAAPRGRSGAAGGREVIGCIGPVIDLPAPHPLALGSAHLRPLAEIFDDAQRDLVLHALRAWGPKKLMALLADAGLAEQLPRTFIQDSVCDARYQLMSNPSLVRALEVLAGDPTLVQTVAYHRAYYLGEPEMVYALGLARSSA